jgi:RecB family endonuclease NucS
VEIKRIPADSNSVKQLHRYISDLRTTSPQVRGILLAPSINASAKNLARSLSIEYYSLDLKKIADIYSKKYSSDVERLDKHLF